MACDQPQPGSAGNPRKFRNQDYESLRAACLKSRSLFSDPEFSADQKSIGMPADPDPSNAVKWLRPKEISRDAKFIQDTTDTTDICQGQLGDCWLLAALSCLTLHPRLFTQVVPSDQSMDEPYAGIFHFRFWQYGEWVEVVVDDRLPVRSGRLLFSYSRTRNEFWSALVEKAYAKLIGSYGSLKGGNISEGMEDFMGGIARALPVSARTPRVLWRAIGASLSRGTLISCFIQAPSMQDIGRVNSQGLVMGHAYAITETNKVQKESGEVLLLRLRNPWGFVEYCGPWSDKCDDWDKLDSSEKNKIKLIKAEDGEFWINVEDFSKLFEMVEMCSVNPDSLLEEGHEVSPTAWTISSYHGSWVPGCSAGGSRKFRRSFWQNPQYRLILSERDEDEDDDDDDDDGEDDTGDDDVAEEGAGEAVRVMTPEERAARRQREKRLQCTVVVELLQKHRRQRDKVNFLYIAFHIYRVPPELQDSLTPLSQRFFSSNRPVARSGKYRAMRGVRRKIHLDPGHYVIVVSTFRPNQPADFFLRIFAKTGNTLGEKDFICASDFLMAVQSKPVIDEDHNRVRKLFDQEAGPDGRLDAVQFQNLVNSVLDKDYQLPLDTCRQLILSEDAEGRSRPTLPQTEKLLSSLRTLQSIFLKYDEDSSGTMSPFELSLALDAAGLKCSREVQEALWGRVGAGELHLPFHGFVSCVTKLHMLFALYESESSTEVKERGIHAWLLKFLVV
ncbi:calpain-12 [Megalops cyprinoides]|uniref:calpain-12 n=1 Tax=Megalops cyprinoides TaxID=118141 RepID=UPI0018654E12|nr:calpain-12 [Megalops cyprinoides]